MRRFKQNKRVLRWRRGQHGHARSETEMRKLSWEQVFLGNGPDDCCGRLGEVTRSLRLRQRWLRQSVGRQSSLTENQLSNQCANRESARRAEKARDSRGFRGIARYPDRAAMPCICAVAHMLA